MAKAIRARSVVFSGDSFIPFADHACARTRFLPSHTGLRRESSLQPLCMR